LVVVLSASYLLPLRCQYIGPVIITTFSVSIQGNDPVASQPWRRQMSRVISLALIIREHRKTTERF